MDEVKRLIEEALAPTMVAERGCAVIHGTDKPGLYVQWAVLPTAVLFEVSDPEAHRSRRSQGRPAARRGSNDAEGPPALSSEQAAALSQLGFRKNVATLPRYGFRTILGFPKKKPKSNYQRYLAPGELEQGQIADLLASALRLLGLNQASDITVEIISPR